MKVGLSPILLLTLSPNWVLKLEKMTSLEKYCGQCIYFRLKYAANNFHTPDITTIKRNKNNQALFPKGFIRTIPEKLPIRSNFLPSLSIKSVAITEPDETNINRLEKNSQIKIKNKMSGDKASYTR